MNLYEINAELMKAWESAVDEETGEILDEVALENLGKLELAFNEKLENTALWVKNLLAYAEAIKNEKMALAKRQKAVENKAESLKRYLSSVLDGGKYSSPRCAVSFRKSEAVEVEADAIIPDEYLTFKAPEPNKTALKKALKGGAEIAGVTLVEKQNIQIK